jgi:hypothetical protein
MAVPEMRNDEGGRIPVGVPAQRQKKATDCGLAHDDEKPEDTTQGDRPARSVTCPSSAARATLDKDAGIGCGKFVIEPWSVALDKDTGK